MGIALSAAFACTSEPPPPVDSALASAAVCDTAGARAVVEQFGARLRDVSLLAPDSVVRNLIREAYSPYVTRELLERWISHLDSAPGRKVSSPWPDRIRVDSVSPAGPQTCRVAGQVIYTTSVNETQGGDTLSELVVLRVTGDTAWRIDEYTVRPN